MPTVDTVEVVVALRVVRPGVWVTVTVAVAVLEVTPLPRSVVPDAVAESWIDPWSRSACVVL